jgi:hypothetical protein
MDDQDQQDPDPDINTSTSASASTSTNQQNDARASSVLLSLFTSLKKFLSPALSVLTICLIADAIMPDFLMYASKADNEIYAHNYGDNFGDYVEFASKNYGGFECTIATKGWEVLINGYLDKLNVLMVCVVA